MNRKGLSLFLATVLSLVLLPALFSLFQTARVAHAATFTVDTVVDESDGSCDTDCSLRDAIALAASEDTIFIPAGTYLLSDTLGQLNVSKTLIFSGTGVAPADVIIVAGADARLFNVTSGTSTFFNLTLQGGNPTSGNGGALNATGGASLIAHNTIITNNHTNGTGSGGGIALTNGTLTLTNTQVVSNTSANNGGGIYTNNGLINFTTSQVLTNTAVNSGGGIALNLANARLMMNSGQVNDNVANTLGGTPGGGIYVAQGSAVINGGEIRNNLAFRGGGILVSGGISGGSVTINNGSIIDNEANYGGGVYAFGQTASVIINGGEVTLNRSVHPTQFGGGGLYIFQGQITMNGGEISSNTATNDGGALEIGDINGRFVQNGGAIFNNSAGGTGGAVYNSQGQLTINGGTIYGNNSTGPGGGIANDGNSTISHSAILTNTSTGGNGGGVYNMGNLTMTNVTLGNNNAANGGGLNNTGTVTLTNVTLSQNNAITNGGGLRNNSGTLTVSNSIIFGNTATTGDDCNGTITSAGNNISTCSLGGSGDISTDPNLQPLALNGGETLNYAVDSGSSAVDSGSNALCPADDQRGNLRPLDGNGDSTATCDIGAYEYGIGFFISDATLTEGDAGSAAMSFTVTRSFITDTTYTVDYATLENGTAISDTDYTAVPPTTLTFNPSDITKTVTIDILGDTLDENDETFSVVLSNQSPEVFVGDFSGTGTILDNDDPPTLTIGDVTVTEGSSTAVFTATLSAASGKTIEVDYETMDGTAEAGSDYTAVLPTTLTFNPGDTEETFAIDITTDALDEDDETFSVALSNESNVTLADSSAQATITDDDEPPTISIADATVSEGNSGTTTADFIVTLSAPSGKTITINYATAAASATAGTDYEVVTSGTLTFPPGDTTETATVTVNGDTIDENNETFLVNLSNESNVTIGDGQATGTITDDDAQPTASINDATTTEGDSGTVTAVFTVTLSAASEKTITINYNSTNGSATAGSDYTAVPASVLTFDPGDPLSKTISVTVLGDENPEDDEQFFINLTGSSNVTLVDSQGIGTIIDDDGVTVFLPFIVKP